MLQKSKLASQAGNAAVTVTRRGLLASLVALSPLAFDVSQHRAADADTQSLATEVASVAQEPACASCVGYVDGTLGSCSAVAEPCTSSYDDRPGAFIAPWQYDGSTQAAKQQLVQQLQVFGASVEKQTEDYVYAVLDQGPSGVLDLEFVFAPNDTTVRFLQLGMLVYGCWLVIAAWHWAIRRQ